MGIVALRIVPALAAVAALAACGGGDGTTDAGLTPVGVAHVLAVEPGGRAVLVGATGGLFRTTRGGGLALVGDARRDVTALAAVGGALVGSGHPPPTVDAPPDSGLMRSADGGRTWRPVSLAGAAELRLLRAARGRLYALDGTTGSLMASADGGRHWGVRSTPPGLADLAVDPADPDRLLGTSAGALWRSDDGGRHWDRPDGPSGALAWLADGRVFVAAPDAGLHLSADGGRTWRLVGRLPAPVIALAAGAGRLFGLLSNGTVVTSRAEGGPWILVARP